jgi:hypothetical protein
MCTCSSSHIGRRSDSHTDLRSHSYTSPRSDCHTRPRGSDNYTTLRSGTHTGRRGSQTTSRRSHRKRAAARDTASPATCRDIREVVRSRTRQSASRLNSYRRSH